MGNLATIETSRSPLVAMADRLQINPAELESVVKKTLMPANVQVSNEQFLSFLVVANNYALDPLKKEIYAFPAKGGGIQPVVSIDGWLSIINSHPQFDGMELVENYDKDGKFDSVTCSIFRKDRSRPIVVTECLNECIRQTEPWKKPKRMLRHKAAIQCARYAFGLSGIVEQDEAEAALVGEREIGPAVSDLNDAIKKRASSVQAEDAVIVDPDPRPADAQPKPQPDPEPEELPLAAMTYAEVMAAINAANSPESMQAAKEAMIAFCGEGDNDKFQEELGKRFRERLAELKGK